MAEDPEKRFHTIMNKLFHSPKSNSSISSLRKVQGHKRPYAAMELNLKGDKIEGNSNPAQPPSCRPWDRADLMRRLATFKSMKWFAKPKSVDAVSCARRGWVNVDMDIIACEVCGARLQFTTPSTWHQQQVEKAALVFSLQLDSGHKPLCPWIDNDCDESLALFPPKPAPLLVDEYKERSSALLQLSALPLISSSAIESMLNPQLEHFLKQPVAVECSTGPKDSTWTESFGTDMEAVSGDSYYQAHRLLSLCGWKPRLLPYIVDCGDKHKLSGSNNNLTGVSNEASGEQKNELCVYVSGSDESTKDNENPGALSAYQDPSSTVLDCKLCGASVGLWAFVTVPRPLEMVRFVGSSDFGGEQLNESESSAIVTHSGNGSSDPSGTKNSTSTSSPPALNLTIAGGPPPAKQNFKATISLPVIGRNVRARFSYLSSEIRNTENLPNEERRDPHDNDDTSNANDVQSCLTSTIGDDITNDQLMHIDDTISAKETSNVPTNGQKDDGVEDICKTGFTSATIDKDLRRHCADRMMEFHPVRQHRHFCPWGTSTNTTAPGWLQTLSALQKEKVFSLPDNQGSPLSPSFIRVDDPITSIRKLFESPPAKRQKSALMKNVN
ncbi:uncharacterized protein LOC141601578 [Silene latifolia]|uniref:uncharacterized protein LOC141601578 n=1 Tax=Silene latifolia TaxID=37657 RepID=UPI003D76C54A